MSRHARKSRKFALQKTSPAPSEKTNERSPQPESHATFAETMAQFSDSPADLETLEPTRVLQLQRIIGNQAVQRLIAPRRAASPQIHQTQSNQTSQPIQRQPAATAEAPAAEAQAPSGNWDGYVENRLTEYLESYEKIKVRVSGASAAKPVYVNVHPPYMLNSDKRVLPAMKQRNAADESTHDVLEKWLGEKAFAAKDRWKSTKLARGRGERDKIRGILEDAIDQGVITPQNGQAYPTGQQMHDWLQQYGIGVDCTAFVQYALVELLQKSYGAVGEKAPSIKDLGVGALQSDDVYEEVTGDPAKRDRFDLVEKPSEAKSGDVYVKHGHIRIIVSVEQSAKGVVLNMAESTAADSDRGPRSKTVTLPDQPLTGDYRIGRLKSLAAFQGKHSAPGGASGDGPQASSGAQSNDGPQIDEPGIMSGAMSIINQFNSLITGDSSDSKPEQPTQQQEEESAWLEKAVRLNERYRSRLWSDYSDAIVMALQEQGLLPAGMSPGPEMFAAAVKEYQANKGLTADGILGPNTWSSIQLILPDSALMSVMPETSQTEASGESSEGTQSEDENWLEKAVRLNQRYGARLWQSKFDDIVMLFQSDALLPPDMSPGPELFAEAVKQYQAVAGLEADGILGPDTWAALKPLLAAPAAESESQQSGEVAPADPSAAQGETDWTKLKPEERMAYVMNLLVNTYNYPEEGAAGLVGNLYAESGVLPNRIEGSKSTAPMTARNFQGEKKEFTPEEVMNRSYSAKQGPRLPGAGLAQWTSANRRKGLFEHEFQGQKLGAEIMNNMDAQVDYLVHELQSSYKRVNQSLMSSGVNDASDDVVYDFERPGSIIDDGKRLPRTDPRVQSVFEERRRHSNRALEAYRSSQ